MSEKHAAYTKTIDAQGARALFRERWGYAPLEVLDAGPVWLAGPIRQGPGLHGPLLRATQAPLPLGGGNGDGRQGGLMRRATAARRPMTATEARQLALQWEV